MSKEELKDEEVIKDEETDEDETPEVLSLTQEELEKKIQAETDRKTTKALETARNKWQEEYEAKLDAERSEAEKLAGMNAEEKAQAQFKAEREAWLEEKKQFEKERMQLETTKLLNAEGLPVSFVDYIVGETADEVSENIKTFKEEWKKALGDAVSEKLKGRVPSGSSLQNKDIMNMTKEEFGELPYKERARMLEIDPDILDKLKK